MHSTSQHENLPELLQGQFIPKTFFPEIQAQKKGFLTAEAWRQRIDETWGAGTRTVEERLTLFDLMWGAIDRDFACFQDLDVDWQAIKDKYRPEIEAGVSRGRFAAILNHMVRPLRELHTRIHDIPVNFQTALTPGTPLLYVGGRGVTSHFGAALTPLPDKTLLVYAAVEDHPLGLVPGDIVLGYEGRPWHEIYPELIAAELPTTGSSWGSSPSAYEHAWLMGAGLNWHLFDTIDIRKFDTGETVQLQTAPLAAMDVQQFATEQLPIPGIPLNPSIALSRQAPVNWGVIEGTRIGYIYVWAWRGSADFLFEKAVRELTIDTETDGLIIDFRTNFGGGMTLSNPGLSLLFDKPVETINFVRRSDPNDHFAFQTSREPSIYVIPGEPDTNYDKPIAVLVGPGAGSSGDQVALRMKFHPRVRTFGKGTSGTFNSPRFMTLDEDFRFAFALEDAYLLSDPSVHLTHDEFQVDEPVWLTPEDVAVGRDTVVEAARAWITKQNEPCASARWVNHVTAANGGFVTQVLIANDSSEEKHVVLAPYDSAGQALTEVELRVPGKSTHEETSDQLFAGEAVSHFRICAPESVTASVAYRTASLDGGSAHIHETSTTKTTFRLYAGLWDYIFDGMALVNLGDVATSVRVSLLDFAGNQTASVTINEALPAKGKQLVVFESVFPQAEQGIIFVETDQPASALFLRGTRAGVTPSYLYQNNQLPTTP